MLAKSTGSEARNTPVGCASISPSCSCASLTSSTLRLQRSNRSGLGSSDEWPDVRAAVQYSPAALRAPLWMEAMLAALQTGVKGGKWHSLIDKVLRLETLELGWTQVKRNAGAAGVDRVSVERFAQERDYYLAELASALRSGSYRPQPVRRVYIPKGKGQRPMRCVRWTDI